MEFFAVTTTSVYKVTDQIDDKGFPIVEKIALKGESSVPVGARLQNGDLVGISKERICLYSDEDDNTYPTKRTQRRSAEEVNTRFWGGGTSPIIALFFNEDEALKCLNTPDLEICDVRWRKQTEEVLATIGNNHPVFVLSKKEFAISFD